MVRQYRLPPDVRARSYDADDIDRLAVVLNASRLAIGVREQIGADLLALRFAHPSNWDPALDVSILEDSVGIVGWNRTWWADTPEGDRAFDHEVFIDPRRRGDGLEAWLTEDAVRRSIKNPRAQKTSRPRLLSTMVCDADPRADTLAATGFVPVRRFLDLVREPLDAMAPAGPLPDGLEERPLRDADLPAVWEEEKQITTGMWGFPPQTDEVYERFLGDPRRENDLWTTVWSGDVLAGHVIVFIDPEENEANGYARAWIWTTAVNPDFRRHNLGAWLIRRSAEKARARGMTSIALGTDPDFPDNPLLLYRFLRFRVEVAWTHWRRPLMRNDPAAIAAIARDTEVLSPAVAVGERA